MRPSKSAKFMQLRSGDAELGKAYLESTRDRKRIFKMRFSLTPRVPRLHSKRLRKGTPQKPRSWRRDVCRERGFLCAGTMTEACQSAKKPLAMFSALKERGEQHLYDVA